MNLIKDYKNQQRANLPEGITYEGSHYWFGSHKGLTVEGLLWLKNYLQKAENKNE